MDVFTSKRIFGGYFQWNVCTHFQKIFLWKRHQHSKFVRQTSIIFLVLLRFCFRKKALKVLTFWILLPLKEPLVATFSKTRALMSRKKYFWNRHEPFKFFRQTSIFLSALLLLTENMYLNKIYRCQIYPRQINLFGCTPPFLL